MSEVMCATPIFLILGILLIFFKDFAWELQEWGNSSRNVHSERTETWNFVTTVTGMGCIIFAIGLFLWSFAMG